MTGLAKETAEFIKRHWRFVGCISLFVVIVGTAGTAVTGSIWAYLVAYLLVQPFISVLIDREARGDTESAPRRKTALR
jgi:hypothetical protein